MLAVTVLAVTVLAGVSGASPLSDGALMPQVSLP